MNNSRSSAYDWSIGDVASWLEENGLSKYKLLLCDEHQIDGRALLALTEDDLRKPPVQITVLGDIKRITSCVSLLHTYSNVQTYKTNYKNSKNPRNFQFNNQLSTRKDQREKRYSYSDDDDDVCSFTTDNPDGIDPKKLSPLEEEIRNAVISESFRTAVSVLYAFGVFLLASFILTVVHDRLPDTKNHPPLPDVFLENIPLMPWAFQLCEICASLMMFFWVLIIIFHKHRLVVLRRSCAISGTIFLLRCFTMYVTSLSVPGDHLQCSPTKYGTFYKRAARAIEIFRGAGMAVHGVRTCGDYMFSGHTATLTLLNFFVTEYTPRRWYLLHTLCWLLNIFGVFFILAAHEHYSIDVLISFYISSRLFMYYHTLASAVQVRTSDERRRRIWFPLFWFFEYGCPLVVPNEYEWPFSATKIKSLFLKTKEKAK